MPYTGIWLDSRLIDISIESKNAQNGLWTRKLWSSEVGRCRAHSLDEVGLAKGGQLGQKRSPRLYLSTKFHPQACGQMLDSRSFP